MAGSAGLIGALIGTSLFTVIALALVSWWPGGIKKVIIVNVVMWLILSLGDNLVRNEEPLIQTFLRLGLVQAVTLFFCIVFFLGRSKSSPEQPR